jgi:hypothetical protein
MRSRSNYFSCSRFADIIRGTPTLGDYGGTSEEWTAWEKEAKEKHPFRYWLSEDGLDLLQDIVMFIPDKIYAAKYWFINRFIDKTHQLTSNLKKGAWHEMDERILHCLFEELINHVEKEMAWMMLISDKKNSKKYNAPRNATGWFRLRTWRCPEAGIDYLIWESTLTKNENWGVSEGDPEFGKPTPQAEVAKTILSLYKWWKVERPSRPDPYDKSGWTEICDRKRGTGDDWFKMSETEEERTESHKSLEILRKIEEEYDAEDTEKLISLIKIRHSLWT